MKIVDAHHHFWDTDANYLPWLADRPVKFRYGNYDALKRPYLPDDYRRDSKEFDVAGTVYVETEWDPTDPLGEIAWVEGVREREGIPTVMVAQAWLDADDVGEVLSGAVSYDFVRGVRHKPRAAERPDKVERGAAGSMSDPAWRRGFAVLRDHGMSFDLQTPWWHLAEAVDLAEAVPGVPIILNHTGLPADRSKAGLDGWREALGLLATVPNAAIKISGLGLAGQAWSAEQNREVVLEAIDIFGVDRVMFASNFPVDSLVGSFAEIFEGFMKITQHLGDDTRGALFHDNAARIYRMDLATAEEALP
ncbi:MAG: amidohydrolase family protein [Pseudomonadota bacterium]